jgi:hypothetical protein
MLKEKMKEGIGYPTNLTDKQWKVVRPFFT